MSRTIRTLLLTCLLLAGGVAAADPYAEALAIYDAATASGDPQHEAYRRAHAAFAPLAAAGDVRARYHLGMLHYMGLGGVEVDHVLAADLFVKSADGGYLTAQAFLGLLAETGDGVMYRRGDDLAVQWYLKAAAQGHCHALRRLAEAREQGLFGLAPDPALARDYRRRLPDCRRR